MFVMARLRWVVHQNRARVLLMLELMVIFIYSIGALLLIQYEGEDSVVIQQDLQLISILQHRYIIPPSDEPYNLTQARQEGDPFYILKYLFLGKKKGTFLEAGAFDGENFSTTLQLEKEWLWSGLLVEPSKIQIKKLMQVNRKAKVFPGCLSITSKPMMVNFSEADVASHIKRPETDLIHAGFYISCSKNEGNVKREFELQYEREFNQISGLPKECKIVPSKLTKAWCIPLYTLLLATDLTDLDFLSLDTEGTELLILKTVPFDLINVKVIRVDMALLSGADQIQLENLMSQYGFIKLKHLQDRLISSITPEDVWFVHSSFRLSPYFT